VTDRQTNGDNGHYMTAKTALASYRAVKIYELTVSFSRLCMNSAGGNGLGRCHSVAKPKNRPGPTGAHKIALDITAVEFDQFSLYSTGTMIIYDRLSL